MALPIDVGSGAADLESYHAAGWTLIDKANPANLSGLLTSVDVWTTDAVTGFVIGVFTLVSGTTYSCRSSATIGAVTGGAKRTFSVSLPIQAGDFIGCYYTGGSSERSAIAGSGFARLNSESISPGDQAAFVEIANQGLSLYGQGIVRGWSSK